MEKTKFEEESAAIAEVRSAREKNGLVSRKPRPLDLDPSIYLRNDYVVVDLETTNLDHGSPINPSNRVVLACWALGGGSRESREQKVRTRFGNELEQAELAEAIRRASFVVAFNAKFELGWFRRMGLELRDIIVYDPMLGEYVLYGNQKPTTGLGLDATLKRYGIHGKMSYVSALIENGVCPSQIPSVALEAYGIRDVEQTRLLFLRQRERIHRLGLQNVLYGRCLQTPMLADIESRGVWLDKDRVRSERAACIERFSRAEAHLGEFCGALNWRSTKQVRELVYGRLGFAEPTDYLGRPIRTKGGEASTNEEVLGKLHATTAAQKRFKHLYGLLAPLKKELSTLESMWKICEEANGHFYAQFNQAVTQNHRLSSTGLKYGLQLQNTARSFKKLFRSGDAGRSIAEGDCPQLEYRVAIDLTRDPVGLADVLARADPHSLSSSVTGLSRTDAKPHTFKPIYGGTSGPPRLRRYYDAFRTRYRVLYQGQMAWVYTVLVDKQLTTATGLVFYWPDTEVTPSGYITNTTKIFNYPISMLATADISQLSLVLTWHGMRGWDSYICNTVHDSGVGDITVEEARQFEELMVQSYTQDIYGVVDRLYNYKLAIPLGLGFKCGERWGEGEERKYEPDNRFKFTSDVQTAIKL